MLDDVSVYGTFAVVFLCLLFFWFLSSTLTIVVLLIVIAVYVKTRWFGDNHVANDQSSLQLSQHEARQRLNKDGKKYGWESYDSFNEHWRQRLMGFTVPSSSPNVPKRMVNAQPTYRKPEQSKRRNNSHSPPNKLSMKDGGPVKVKQVPGLEVNFPPCGLDETIEAYIKLPPEEECHHDIRGLASPIVMVGPHGYQFNPGGQPAIITIPIPDYDQIKQRFGERAKLSIWQSATAENEPLNWESVDVQTDLQHHASGTVTISFPVEHFSFFKAVWDILSAALYEAKL
ncbi:hypothetical protein CHUAL_011719 [Chamberlinius hualienensis]